MCNEDFFWRYFTVTGHIGAYLIYKNLLKEEQEDDYYYFLAVPDEE